MIVGEKVYLRAVEEDDLPQLMAWRNIPEYRKHFREFRELNTSMQKKWFEQIVLGDNNTIMFSICTKGNDTLIGCCGLCYINWVHRNADLSMYIGYEESYIDNVGFAEDACCLLFDYGFRQLNLHKIWTEIYEFDYRKNTLYEKLGFHQDGLLRENYFHDGRWWDSRILSLLSFDYNKFSSMV